MKKKLITKGIERLVTIGQLLNVRCYTIDTLFANKINNPIAREIFLHPEDGIQIIYRSLYLKLQTPFRTSYKSFIRNIIDMERLIYRLIATYTVIQIDVTFAAVWNMFLFPFVSYKL